MCKDKKNNKSKGEDNMNAIAANNIDFLLAELLKNNSDKIKASTPLNPTLSKDDEWINEQIWDELYEEKKNK